MTLTGEQIDQYADDKCLADDWHFNLKVALDLLEIESTGAGFSVTAAEVLHAHAKRLRLEAENARLTALIEEHNKKCSRIFCAYPRCSEREFQRCEKCPLDMMIDTERKES